MGCVSSSRERVVRETACKEGVKQSLERTCSTLDTRQGRKTESAGETQLPETP